MYSTILPYLYLFVHAHPQVMGNGMSPRERVLSAISMHETDRKPAAIFTQSATVSQMERCGVYWPEANYDPSQMAVLASQARFLGFDSVRVPFCLTIEAERLGSTVDKGSGGSTPVVRGQRYLFAPGTDEAPDMDLMGPDEFISGGRPKTVIDAVALLSRDLGSEYPVIAGMTGPMTIVAGLISAESLLIAIMMEEPAVEEYLKKITVISGEYVSALSDAGADVIQMSEGLASPDMLMPGEFDRFSGRFVRDIFLAGGPDTYTSLHICGDTTAVLRKMSSTGANCLSIEEKVDPFEARRLVGNNSALVGNVGAVFPLMSGTAAECSEAVKLSMDAGFDVIAPGCGLPAKTPDENLRAMSDTVRTYRSRSSR